MGLRGGNDASARAGGVGALWQCVGATAALSSICGADAGGRVSSGANQPGHPCCGHWGGGGERGGNTVSVTEPVCVCVFEMEVC